MLSSLSCILSKQRPDGVQGQGQALESKQIAVVLLWVCAWCAHLHGHRVLQHGWLQALWAVRDAREEGSRCEGSAPPSPQEVAKLQEAFVGKTPTLTSLAVPAPPGARPAHCTCGFLVDSPRPRPYVCLKEKDPQLFHLNEPACEPVTTAPLRADLDSQHHHNDRGCWFQVLIIKC